MNPAAVAALGVLGLAVGLVLNVVIDRVPGRQPLRDPRFRCPRCPEDGTGHPRLPIGAWLRPGAPCPACGQRLPSRYWLVPLACAALYVAAAIRLGPDWALPAYLLFFASLLAISVIDLQLQIIPNRIVYPTIFAAIPLLALAAFATDDWEGLVHALVSGAVAWVALLVIHLIQPGGMGFGDVRLSFLLGMFLGWIDYGHALMGIFLGFLLGAVVGLLLVGLRIRSRTDHVPFGPFLAAGAAITVLAGGPLVRGTLG